MTVQKCSAAATETSSQSGSSLWFDLSKDLDLRYDVAHCKKNDGVLVQQILGVSKYKAILAMNRAKQLEEDAITPVETKIGVKLNRTGLITDNKITAEYNAQVQLQMFLLNKKKCLFCLANPNFEISNT
nr:unnamed protein product [Callosobruchus chinensis]